MMNRVFRVACGVACIGLAVMVLVSASAVQARFPDGFIPMWSKQKGGSVTALLNTNQICSIVPTVDLESVLGHERGKESYLEVHFSDGSVKRIYEDFEEFYSRIRSSQR
tara:strand:+ start:804 stop:1130 length:327 start_codon:yes stop_codon:yes gene_type:complete